MMKDFDYFEMFVNDSNICSVVSIILRVIYSSIQSSTYGDKDNLKVYFGSNPTVINMSEIMRVLLLGCNLAQL